MFTKIKKKSSSENEYQRALEVCRQCSQYLKNQQDFSLAGEFLKQEGLLHSIYKKSELSRKVKEDRAQVHVDRAKFFAEKNNFLVAAWEYEDALKVYMELGDKEKIKLCKSEMTGTRKESIKQFGKFSHEIEIPAEEIKSFSENFLSVPNLNDALSLLSLADALIPNYQKLWELTEESKANHPLQYAVRRSTVDDAGHSVANEDDPFQSELRRNALLKIQLNSIFLDHIFQRLKNEKGLNKETLYSFLRSWGLIDENNLKIIECGLENYFSEDYVGSMHILVPQLESVIRNFLKKAGVQAISSVRGTTNTQESTLSDLLNRDEVREKLTEDLHWYITLILVEKLGFNFRNDVAHGLIKFDSLNLSNSNLILHLFILLTRLKID